MKFEILRHVVFLFFISQCCLEGQANFSVEKGNDGNSGQEVARLLTESSNEDNGLQDNEVDLQNLEDLNVDYEEINQGKRSSYGFGLGKHGNNHEVYGFGLGKKSNPYAFGLGKRILSGIQLGKKGGQVYAFGLGKRNPYAFGLGKRREYSFGLGKRSPYTFGLGRKRDPYAFGLGK